MAGRALDLAQVERLIRPAFPDGRVSAATPLSLGLTNASYRVALAGVARDIVLRIYRHDPAAAAREFAVARLLRDTVPVPEFLHLDPTGALGGRPYALLPWIEGQTMADAVAGASPDDLASLGRTLGTTLAAIGRHGFAASGILDANLRVQPWPEPMAAFLRRCLSEGKGAARLDAAARDAAIDFAQAQCGVLTTLFADCRLVHGDFGMANILLTRQAESWRVVAVLDWEFCHAGTPMTDIGTLLRGKPGRSPEFEEAFANAFRDHGGILPERWRHLARFLDLVTLCDFLSRGSPPSGLAAYADALLAESAENWKNGL